jgi:hypothetical protein
MMQLQLQHHQELLESYSHCCQRCCSGLLAAAAAAAAACRDLQRKPACVEALHGVHIVQVGRPCLRGAHVHA